MCSAILSDITDVASSKTTDEQASNIKEYTRSVLNSVDWSVYVETRAEKRGVELLKKHGVVIVVGCPGSGKTTLALRMMREIEKEEKRESYSLTHHYEFNDISLFRNKKFVVLIDDIFGKTNLVSYFRDSWKPKFIKVWSLVQDGSLKCIITLRKQIFSETKTSLKKFGLFNENHVFDLCCLNYYEKEQILNKYLKKHNVTVNENGKKTVIYNSFTELGFPQMCVYYVNSSDAQKRGVEFFKKPVEYLRQELENLKTDKTLQINYLVLLLILFKEGSLSIDSLDPFKNDSDSDIMKLIRLLEQVCPSLKNTGLRDIKKTADVMCGTYLKCCENKYTFIHQSVIDCLFLMFSVEFSKKAAEFLEVSPVSMLLEYVVQCRLGKGADPNLNADVNQKLIQQFEEEIKLKLWSDDKTSLNLSTLDSPLHISVLRGDLDMLKSLIKRNADVNAVNSEGKTPLHETVKAVKHRKEVALLLLQNGADTNITDKKNNSALHIASQIDIKVVKEVVKKGVQINVINTEGQTPLFLSLYSNKPEITSYLLKHGADPNLTDIHNNSVLHLAAEHGNLKIVRALIEKGVDVNIKNGQGETPLFTAVKYEHCKVVLYLLEHGADPHSKDNNNNSILHLAAKHGNRKYCDSSD